MDERTTTSRPVVYIGLDGEGYWDTEKKTHIYDMLKIGDAHIGRPGTRISHRMAFRTIRSVATHWLDAGYQPIIVGYAINYDLTQIARSLGDWELSMLADRDKRGVTITPSERQLENWPRYRPWSKIFRPVKVEAGDKFSPDRWRIDWLPGKWYTLSWPVPSSLAAAQRTGDESRIKWQRVKVVDVFSAFGGGFLPAVEQWLGDDLSDTDRRVITAGKAERGHEITTARRRADWPRVSFYNAREIELLERLVVRFYETTNELLGGGLTPEVTGPGCIAAHWLDQRAAESEDEDTPTMSESWTLAESITGDAYDFINNSYFGGWFETFRFGMVDDVYEYDLNSAYPAVIRSLPSLVGATSEWTTDPAALLDAHDAGDLAYVDATIYGASRVVGPAPYRDQFQQVTRPRDCRTLVTIEELVAASNAGLVRDWEVHRGLIIRLPNRDTHPYAEIESLYQHRLDVGKKSLEGMATKLVINSVYGKLCQSVGQFKWGNPIHAGLITSRTRVQLLDAIATHPGGVDSLISVATDAVFFDSPHPSLDIHPTRLGAWDLEQFDRAYFIQSGVWGAQGYDDEGHAWWDVRTRGMSARAFRAELETAILPELERAERERTWNEGFTFTTRETFTMLSLPLAYEQHRIRDVGEFLTGDHGTPEVLKELSLRVGPKRDLPTWCGNGFQTVAPRLAANLAAPTVSASASRPDMIGAVTLR